MFAIGRLGSEFMLLTEIRIENFRGIEDLTLPLDELCVLIGENNAGKSSILDALKLCLTRSLTRKSAVFEEYDYHLADAASDPSRAEPIVITLTFAERREGEWSDEISQILSDAEQIDKNSLRSITLRITSRFDQTLNNYATDYDFLDLAGNILTPAKNPRLLINLQQLIPTFYLSSLRDAAQEFRPRSQFWRPFVRALELDEETRAELESALLELNKLVLDHHTAFENVKDRLKNTAELLPHGDSDPVSIEAVPSKVFDVLSRTQINLSSKTGAQIPIARHGSGTQSLAVICLFDAFLQSQLQEGYRENAKPILALEEPEAHLHPSAIKTVGEMLKQISGQKLITTHSGDLLASVPLKNIRRFRRKNGKVTVHKLNEGSLTDDELKKLDYHVRSMRGSLLFSRCWLLVEGETEVPLIFECCRALGHDLHADGISCIEYSTVGVEKFIKLADELGIEWLMLADKDQAGEKYVNSAREHLNARNEEDHIQMLEHGSMEVFLCMEGFGEIYKATIADQKRGNIDAENGTIEHWRQVLRAQKKGAKTRNSLIVAEEIINRGQEGVPELIKDVIERARKLARSAA
ncbi:MAG: DUF2813 domain-containing protein [Aestuariivita sp.]|nr:DUF2813 domain-containing protein [Aestuariivita sp.]